jgi:hypothetical protein
MHTGKRCGSSIYMRRNWNVESRGGFSCMTLAGVECCDRQGFDRFVVLRTA